MLFSRRIIRPSGRRLDVYVLFHFFASALVQHPETFRDSCQTFEKYIKSRAPPEYHEKLIPSYRAFVSHPLIHVSLPASLTLVS